MLKLRQFCHRSYPRRSQQGCSGRAKVQLLDCRRLLLTILFTSLAMRVWHLLADQNCGGVSFQLKLAYDSYLPSGIRVSQACIMNAISISLKGLIVCHLYSFSI